MENKIAALLGAGYEVSFTREGDQVTCHTINADGEGITATGATIAEALRNATPEAAGPDPDVCICGHYPDVHPMAGGSACTECDCAEFEAAVPFVPDEPEFTIEERLSSLEIWAPGIVERLDKQAASREQYDSLVEIIFKRAYGLAHDGVVHRVDALDVRLEEIETALRDVLVLAPYLRTFSERVTALEERAGHPYAA